MDIFTRQQLNATENYGNKILATKDYLEQKIKFNSGSSSTPSLFKECHLSYYDVHNGKILHLLTKHSLWNRKHLMHKFSTGKRVVIKAHQCELVTKEEHLAKYDR